MPVTHAQDATKMALPNEMERLLKNLEFCEQAMSGAKQ